MMKEYTIRDTQTGAVIMTGYRANTSAEAIADFYREHPFYEEGEAYASESGWND